MTAHELDVAVLRCIARDEAVTIVDVAQRLDKITDNDGAIYLSLRRLTEEGYLARESVKAVSSYDGKERSIGVYTRAA